MLWRGHGHESSAEREETDCRRERAAPSDGGAEPAAGCLREREAPEEGALHEARDVVLDQPSSCAMGMMATVMLTLSCGWETDTRGGGVERGAG